MGKNGGNLVQEYINIYGTFYVGAIDCIESIQLYGTIFYFNCSRSPSTPFEVNWLILIYSCFNCWLYLALLTIKQTVPDNFHLGPLSGIITALLFRAMSTQAIQPAVSVTISRHGDGTD